MKKFRTHNCSQLRETVIKKNLLSQNGVIYIECEKSYALNSEMYGLRKIKESKGGEVKFYLYEG